MNVTNVSSINFASDLVN